MESLCDQNNLQEIIYHYDSWPSDNILSWYVGGNLSSSRWHLLPKSSGLSEMKRRLFTGVSIISVLTADIPNDIFEIMTSDELRIVAEQTNF